jgi:hypothetical protein
MANKTYRVNRFGTKLFYLNSQYHREDGPAVECIDNYCEFYLNGNYYPFQDYLKELKKIGKNNKEIMLIALKYG